MVNEKVIVGLMVFAIFLSVLSLVVTLSLNVDGFTSFFGSFGGGSNAGSVNLVVESGGLNG